MMTYNIKPSNLYILCALTLILYILFGFTEFENNTLKFILSAAGVVVSIFWIHFIMKESHFTKTPYFRLCILSLSVTIIGYLCKLQHWPFAAAFLVAGYVGCMGVYMMRFMNKKKKHMLDYSKLLWVESSLLISLLVLMHKIDSDYTIINGVFFILMICIFTQQYATNLRKY